MNIKSEKYKNRNFLILNVSEIYLIDFSELLETSSETLRKNNSDTKTVIKWEDKKPKFVNDLKTAEGPYTYDQIIDILNTDEWKKPIITN